MANLRVLHVEDDESIRAITEVALQDIAGFQLLSCASGAEAVANAAAFAPQVMLLDVMMPGMDGLETMHALRQQPCLAQVPVIFMTAKIQDRERESYVSAGAIGVIEKPFNPLELGAQLLQLLSQHSADK